MKRYEIELNAFENGLDIIEVNDGAWVLYEDVEDLIEDLMLDLEEYRARCAGSC